MDGKVVRTENGVEYEAPSQADWDRGVRLKSTGGGGSTVVQSKVSYANDDLEDKPDDNAITKASKRQRRLLRDKETPAMGAMKTIMEKK